MAEKMVFVSANNISGAVNIGNNNQSVINGGSANRNIYDPIALSTLITDIKAQYSTTPHLNPLVTPYVSLLESEIRKDKVDKTIVKRILEELKSIAEGTIGSIIATYLMS